MHRTTTWGDTSDSSDDDFGSRRSSRRRRPPWGSSGGVSSRPPRSASSTGSMPSTPASWARLFAGAALPVVAEWDEVLVHDWLVAVGWPRHLARLWREEFLYGSILLELLGLDAGTVSRSGSSSGQAEDAAAALAQQERAEGVTEADCHRLRASILLANWSCAEVFNWAQRTTALPDMVVDALAEVAVSGPLLWFLDDVDAARFVLTMSNPRGRRSASGSSSARALAKAVGKLKRELLRGGARVGVVALDRPQPDGGLVDSDPLDRAIASAFQHARDHVDVLASLAQGAVKLLSAYGDVFKNTNAVDTDSGGAASDDVGPLHSVEALKSAAHELQSPAMGLAVVGGVNVGKSSLINLLLREPVCPVAPVPSTFCVTQVAYAPHFSCSHGDDYGGTYDEMLADATAVQEALAVLDEDAGYEFDGEGDGDALLEGLGTVVRASCPSGLLRAGLAVIDTPGLCHVPARDEAVLHANMRAPTPPRAAVYVISSSHSTVHRSALAQCLLSFDPEHLFFVFNEFPRRNETFEQRKERRESVFQQLLAVPALAPVLRGYTALTCPNFCAINVEEALQAVLRRAEAATPEAAAAVPLPLDYQSFLSGFVAFVERQLGRRLRGMVAKLESVCATFLRVCPDQHTGASSPSVLAAATEEVDRLVTRVEGYIEDRTDGLREALSQELMARAGQWVDAVRRTPLPGGMSESTHDADAATMHDFVVRQVAMRVQGTLIELASAEFSDLLTLVEGTMHSAMRKAAGTSALDVTEFVTRDALNRISTLLRPRSVHLRRIAAASAVAWDSPPSRRAPIRAAADAILGWCCQWCCCDTGRRGLVQFDTNWRELRASNAVRASLASVPLFAQDIAGAAIADVWDAQECFRRAVAKQRRSTAEWQAAHQALTPSQVAAVREAQPRVSRLLVGTLAVKTSLDLSSHLRLGEPFDNSVAVPGRFYRATLGGTPVTAWLVGEDDVRVGHQQRSHHASRSKPDEGATPWDVLFAHLRATSSFVDSCVFQCEWTVIRDLASFRVDDDHSPGDMALIGPAARYTLRQWMHRQATLRGGSHSSLGSIRHQEGLSSGDAAALPTLKLAWLIAKALLALSRKGRRHGLVCMDNVLVTAKDAPLLINHGVFNTQSVDINLDVTAFGQVLHEMLTGRKWRDPAMPASPASASSQSLRRLPFATADGNMAGEDIDSSLLLPHLGRGRGAVRALELARNLVAPHTAVNPCPGLQDVCAVLEAVAFPQSFDSADSSLLLSGGSVGDLSAGNGRGRVRRRHNATQPSALAVGDVNNDSSLQVDVEARQALAPSRRRGRQRLRHPHQLVRRVFGPHDFSTTMPVFTCSQCDRIVREARSYHCPHCDYVVCTDCAHRFRAELSLREE